MLLRPGRQRKRGKERRNEKMVKIIYCLLGAYVFFRVLLPAAKCKIESPEAKFQRLMKSKEVFGKLSCWVVKTRSYGTTHEAEYVYYVDGKQYFVTYSLYPELQTPEAAAAFNAGGGLRVLTTMPLYYTSNPAKVMCRYEIFCEDGQMQKISNWKKNPYRDVDGLWQEPVRL